VAISRIDLADFGSPDQFAREIVRRIPDLQIPVPIEDIAAQLDITSIEELQTEGFEGGLFTNENKSTGFILVKRSAPRQRRRFTIGHELFHFLCPTHKPLTPDGFLCTLADMQVNAISTADRAKQMEIEANSFSAQLLLPAPYFAKDLRKLKRLDIEHIQSLANRYDTSKEAPARRYVELNDELSKAVVSQGRKILRAYRAKEFPYIEPRFGDEPPHLSRSFSAIGPVGETTEWMEVDAAAWLPSGPGKTLPQMYEQVQHQRNGYMLTLLSIESVDEDEDSADE